MIPIGGEVEQAQPLFRQGEVVSSPVPSIEISRAPTMHDMLAEGLKVRSLCV